MVSWGDGEESSTDVSSDASDGINTLYDSEYYGSDDGLPQKRCRCRSVAGKYVAFEGYNTGRRFLGCQRQEGQECDWVNWVDPVWPRPLQKCLGKLWDMYLTVKRGRTSDALENMQKKFELTGEIERLHKDLRAAQDELQKVVEEKQVTLALKAMAEQALVDARTELEHKKIVDANHSNMHQVLRVNAEKERDKLKDEKRRLEYIIADFMKLKEETRAKFRKIREIADE